MKKSINEKEQCVQTDVMQSVLKQNDCRYGNYIVYSGSITQLNEKEMCHFFRFPETYKPIPLTEEWLVKFRFKKTNESEDVEWYALNNFNIAIHEEDNEVYFVFQHMVLRFIKSVHQLQNLYFALTGSELTVA
jgi:hypothetical protein